MLDTVNARVWRSLVTTDSGANIPECGVLLATARSGANIPECGVEIDLSNNSLRFTHNPSVEKLLATARSGLNTHKHNTQFTHHIYGERTQWHDL